MTTDLHLSTASGGEVMSKITDERIAEIAKKAQEEIEYEIDCDDAGYIFLKQPSEIVESAIRAALSESQEPSPDDAENTPPIAADVAEEDAISRIAKRALRRIGEYNDECLEDQADPITIIKDAIRESAEPWLDKICDLCRELNEKDKVIGVFDSALTSIAVFAGERLPPFGQDDMDYIYQIARGATEDKVSVDTDKCRENETSPDEQARLDYDLLAVARIAQALGDCARECSSVSGGAISALLFPIIDRHFEDALTAATAPLHAKIAELESLLMVRNRDCGEYAEKIETLEGQIESLSDNGKGE